MVSLKNREKNNQEKFIGNVNGLGDMNKHVGNYNLGSLGTKTEKAQTEPTKKETDITL